MTARAELRPVGENDVRGTVGFETRGDDVLVTVRLEGLEPGRHGFHVHEVGDCSAPDASSAGGHFSPRDNPHGAPDDPPESRHTGDLGNVTANEEGRVRTELTDPMLSLSGAHSIIGKAVIVHAGEDDLESQPSGDAGARVACGVIEPGERG